LFSYVDNLGEIYSISSTKDQFKKITPHKVMALLCLDSEDSLDLDDSDEVSTTDYKTLVSQHKDSL